MTKLLGLSVALGAGFILGPLYLAFGLVAVGYVIGESRGRAQAQDALQLDAPRVPITVASGREIPGPIAALVGFARANREPPPVVVAYAIAEARLIGRHDLAHDLIRRFGEPEARPVIDVQPSHAYDEPAPASPASPDSPDSMMNAEIQSPAPPSSPLPGVPDRSWLSYCRALEREPATFENERRVGRYAARKDRLRELGCNPDLLVRHPRAIELQDAALAIDAIDSAEHLAASGTTEAYIGAAISIPDDPEPHKISLSGLLGVAQVAGLEGCVSWLEHEIDRVRFPHTTANFVRTNGAF